MTVPVVPTGTAVNVYGGELPPDECRLEGFGEAGGEPSPLHKNRNNESVGSAEFYFSYKPEVKCNISTKYTLKA